MVKTIKKLIEHYECSECGLQYADRAWAVACEAWCKEHGTCNLEITSHAVPKGETPEKETTAAEDIKFKNRLFYGGIGFAASLTLLLVFYWHLRLNSSIAALISNTADKPLYFWSYIILTLASIALFGINASLLVYRWRKFGPPKLKGQAGTGAGSLVGIAAAACPVCGSVLLSAIGITGGLAAFPLGGLELKALSVGLFALPIWLTRRDMKRLECGDGTCPVPQDASYKSSKDQVWLQGALVMILILVFVGWNMLKTDPAMAKFLASNASSINLGGNRSNSASVKTSSPIFDEVAAKVLPEKGFQSKIVLGDSIVKLAQNGVIDAAKFTDIYKDRGGFPDGLKDVLTVPSNRPILLTRENSSFYVNLLWPIGLANRMSSNESSPVNKNNGKDLFNFASTGGWNLGKEKNGGAYFNKLGIVSLTPEQEALVTKIAQNSYRPCCNNSTFFQDCNHGSALLGLLQLGAAQGLSEDQLWREALAFNSFWFPQQYIYSGLYFKVVKDIDWDKVDPKVVMGKDFSSGSGSGNIQAEVAKIPNLIPQQGHGGGAGCGT